MRRLCRSYSLSRIDCCRYVMQESAMHKIPETMKAVALDRFGGPEVLTLHTLPVPDIGENDILIAVDTVGVGSWDADMREGWSPGRRVHFPLILGTDGSGKVAARGALVRRFDVGDPVYAYRWDNPKGGFYAEFVAVDADVAAHKPHRLTLKQAGAIPVTGLTSLQGVDDVLHIRKGETVIIHGASGAVGTLAVQFAKLRGARVMGIASGADGAALVRQLGATEAVDGRRDDLAAATTKFAPKGIDAVLALADGAALDVCLRALRDGGRLAYPNGVEPEPKKRAGIEVIGYDGIAGPAEFERLDRAVEAAKLNVIIDAEYMLEDAAKAHQRLAAGHVIGKIVLRYRAA